MNEELKVKITAEIGNFKKGCQQATDEINKFKKSNEEAKTALETLEKAINDDEEKLKELKNAYANTVLTQGQNSKSAETLQSKIKELNTKLEANKSKLSDVKNQAEILTKKNEKLKVSFSDVSDEIKKYGDASGKVLKATAGALAGLGTGLLGTAVATSEYRESQAKLTTAFQSAGSTAEQAKNTYNDLYRVLGDSDVAVEASAHLGKLTQDQMALSQWTNICQGVYATFGDSLPIEGLTEASNETAKTGALTGGLADALNWAGMSEEDFQAKLDACNSSQEREALIRGTLNELYSTASVMYNQNNGEILAQNEANRKWADATAQVGEAMAPINTMLTELGADIFTQLTPYITDFADKYLPTIKEVLGNVGEKIGQCITWIADNWKFITTLGGIILGIATAISVVSTVMSVVNAVMLASPVTWIVLGIVAAVAALTAGIILCIKHWDKIKETVSNVVNAMMEKITNFKNSVVEKFNNIKDGIVNTFEKIKNKAKEIVDKIKNFFSFKWELPKIKLPHFNITGGFSLMPPKIPKFSVDWYARGGVFDKPTLFPYGNGAIGGLGEAGAEAVVPLENNTQWLDKIADRLKGNGQPIVLMVDGKVFGEVAVDSINGITAQRGSLPLRLI